MLPDDFASSMLDRHPDPALVVDAGGAVGWMNAAARALTGSPAGGIDLARLGGELLQRSAQGLQLGGRAWRVQVAAPLDGRHLVTLTPIDEVQALAARAQHLAEQLEVAQQLGRLGVWERDLKTLDGRWDRNLFRMWGLDERDGVPHFLQATRSIVAEDRAGLEKAFLDSTHRCGTYSHRFRVRRPDGAIRRLHSQWVIDAGPDGQPQRALGVMMDDTEAWDLARSHDAALTELAVAVDVGQLAVWRRTIGANVLRCNAVARRLLGFDPAVEAHPTDVLIARVHPNDRQTLSACAKRALALNEPVDFEIRMRDGDGAWRHVYTRLVVDRADDGKPLEWVGVSLDITSRRDDARRASELLRRFNLAARTAGIGHWSLEHGASRAHWSDQLYTLHGLPPGSLVPTFGDWLKTYVHADDRATVFQSCRGWTRSGRPSHELGFRLLRSDGAVLHVVTHSHTEGTGEESLVFGVVIDVTERLAAEAVLREAAQRAALIANGVGLGTWEVELETGHAVWDDQMFLLRGLAPAAQALDTEQRLALVHPDDQDSVRIIGDRMARETGTIEHEFRVRWPDGSLRWLASRSSAACDAEGRPLRRLGVNWDVTDARSAIAEREERLAAQREVEAKSRFLSRMSHELRTPLNAVLGFTQLLLADGDAVDTATRTRRLEHICAAGKHLLSLINDVLDLSQLEGGEVTIELQPVPLPALLQDLLPLVEPLAGEFGVHLRTGGIDAVPLADPTRLRQVLLNLLTNAIKYNRRGGEALIEASTAQGIVTLRVADSGRGMSPQQMQHIFEPFNRLGAETLGIEGTGIGLAIVKALVERMGGTVHVESMLDRGSRFELRLRDGRDIGPARQEMASPQAMALAATSRRAGRGGTVLYIEDNAVNTLIVSELIGQRGDLKLLTADTGERGLAVAREARPHLVLLDMQLPDIDGFAVFERLRADPRTARIPCIALSANAMRDDVERAMRAGFADYWTKPLDFRTFTASIDALFGTAPSRAAAQS
jgi:signal transduction histidine kinase/CheY-like chemotaxis protein